MEKAAVASLRAARAQLQQHKTCGLPVGWGRMQMQTGWLVAPMPCCCKTAPTSTSGGMPLPSEDLVKTFCSLEEE